MHLSSACNHVPPFLRAPVPTGKLTTALAPRARRFLSCVERTQPQTTAPVWVPDLCSKLRVCVGSNTGWTRDIVQRQVHYAPSTPKERERLSQTC
eukprot:scaffold14876_cov21-Tisochrysis_lutea.AAC.2